MAYLFDSSYSRPWGVSSSHSESDEKKNRRLFGLDLGGGGGSSSKSPESKKSGKESKSHFKLRKPSFGNVDKSKSAVDLSHIGGGGGANTGPTPGITTSECFVIDRNEQEYFLSAKYHCGIK